MFVVVTSLKGGTGKTTLALHLAGALAASRGRVVCIDADARNRSAMGWVRRGPGLPFEVLDERQAARSGVAAKATHLVIDSQAAPAPDELRASVEGGADVVLVPVIPDGVGLDAAVRTLDVLGTRAHVVLVLAQCPAAPAHAARDAREALADVDGAHVLRTTITRRAAFRDAGTLGRLVFDLAGTGAAAAAAEVLALTQELKRWQRR